MNIILSPNILLTFNNKGIHELDVLLVLFSCVGAFFNFPNLSPSSFI